MPDTVEPLFIFAEVAIALAGFASLVTVIDRGGGDPMALDANRLRNLIDVSLLVVVFSLFPMVPFEFGMADSSAWRVSAVAFLAVTSVYLVVAGRRQRFLRERNIAIRRPWARALWVLAGAMVTSLVLGVAGVGGDIGAAWYVAALFLALVSAALIFILVIASTLQPYRDAPGPAPHLDGDAAS